MVAGRSHSPGRIEPARPPRASRVKLTLTGTSAVEDGQLVTTFDNIPDAPVSSFKLHINGGKGGILVKVGGLGAGKVTVSGKGLKKTTKIIAKSTVATITVRRTRARLGSVKVSFVPKGRRRSSR